MNKAAVIIVNWNGLKFLKDCLESVYKQTYTNFDVYFVDNGSVDDSVDFVFKNFPKVKIIKLDKNTGFAKGNNIGIKEAFKDNEVEYIVCVNNDTIVKNSWLEELVKTGEKFQWAGAVQSKIFLGDRKTIHSTGSIINYDFSSDPRDFGKTNGYHNNESEIESAIGCSLLLKRNIIENCGMFEEYYFAYKEDDEICFKIKNFGYKIFYCPNSVVYHLHSKTLGKQSPRKFYLNEKNRLLNLVTFGTTRQILFSHFYSINRFLVGNNKINKDKNNILFKIRLFILLIKAYLVALFFTPKFLIKRWNLKYNKINE